MLLDATPGLVGGLAEKITTITVLGVFLSYFMKELKNVQNLREADKKETDKKFEQIFNRQYEIEKQNIEAIARQCETNIRLTEAINNLSERIENLQS
ncbi:MAG: hypothetical protein JSS82_14240 [Bacteroidetes bacterium]|nr:hypothetical protein [Bacteroidota bacterium]